MSPHPNRQIKKALLIETAPTLSFNENKNRYLQNKILSLILDATAFNRTTLELKFIGIDIEYLASIPFNRTTLELKYKMNAKRHNRPRRLLTAPLWN